MGKKSDRPSLESIAQALNQSPKSSINRTSAKSVENPRSIFTITHQVEKMADICIKFQCELSFTNR